ncbi:hypothetical protein GCM10025789_07100 [Tessaracoccus lubricantis]|uniref:Phosphotyrosine protein phosphatase I domain-containing protein n=1 Tax=Tessaracoccus lubricantis TaxID=545543 RepID=A0ABP9F2Y1_9ACTN
MPSTKPHLLFVCVKNGGKSQMAAALARQFGGDAMTVTSAGTKPGSSLNQASIEALAEVGATMEGESPKQLTDEMLRAATHVVLVGTEARVEPVEGMTATIEVWDTDEPSLRGIEGEERMRLLREDIFTRVAELVLEVTGQSRADLERYRGIVGDLAHQYEGVFAYDEVRAVVREAHAELAPTTKAPQFLPLFVQRFAQEKLRAGAKAKGQPSDGKPELLFVCVQNAGRSQMAAAMAKHFSNGRVNVRSGGSRPAGQINAHAEAVLAERGMDANYLFSKPLTNDAVEASDVVITMGCGDECPFYPGKRYEDWQVEDPKDRSMDDVRRIADDLEARVKALLDDLGVLERQ